MNIPVESNPLLDRLPPHLRQYIKPQNYEEYTPINQAVWRYVMRKNVDYLGKVAHESYLDGLKQTGISIDHIPSMYGMNRILKEIGWAAVAVDGFIPPNAFMEFQAYKVLVIASDIRQLENIEYTPAPDIIHEGAGHAPIIASPDYAEYLRRFGEIGAKAISSAHDMEMYEAVRKLSILKESPPPNPLPKGKGILTPEQEAYLDTIQKAEEHIQELQNKKISPSEIALIRNLHWWTVEYGLIGTVENPKIYGAGLLSSIGESAWCMTDQVKKLPYSIDAIYQEFDITKPQPQLYVTPDFAYLMKILEEFANTMAVRKGGWRGLQKLIDSKQIGTIELSTGLQISGIFTRMIQNEDNEVIYFETEGETALAYREKELIGHGTLRHRNGFRSPLGKLKGINLSIENMGPRDLQAYHFYDGKPISFEFESGITVDGLNVTGMRNLNGKLMLIQFTNCTVTYKEEVLFSPDMGDFDMALGQEILSAFAGAADYLSFKLKEHVVSSTTIKHTLSDIEKNLLTLYKEIRDMRERNEISAENLAVIFENVKTHYPNDWLLSLEIYELVYSADSSTSSHTPNITSTTLGTSFAKAVLDHLITLKEKRPEIAHLIENGINLLKN